MKRDVDVIREILLALELKGLHGLLSASTVKVDGVEPDLIVYNTMLLMDAGYIVARNASTSMVKNYAIERMTHAGHEFLDAIREPNTWKATKAKILEIGGGTTLDVVKTIAVRLALKKIGLE
jgi:glycerol dehydrogenase-like iron-containing ADH family enzyme